jgi:hypothetical protein
LWSIACLVIMDLAIVSLRPLQWIVIPGVMLHDQDPVGDKVERLLSPKDDSNIFVFGTSLSDSAAANADFAVRGQKPRLYERQRHVRANYFDSQLNKQLGLNAKTFSLGIGGGIVKDMELLLEKALASRNAPGLVVITIGPRDFIDNTNSSERCTVATYFKSRFTQAKAVTDLPSATTDLLNKSWNFYRLRSDYHTVFQLLADQWIAISRHEDPKTRLALKTEEPIFDPLIIVGKDDKDRITAFYKDAYKTVQPDKLADQTASFRKMLTLCRERSIPCLVVSMPLSAHNLSQLPAGFAKEYRGLVARECAANGAKFLYLMDDKRFSDNDFRDNVHLTADGSMRFWNLVAAELGRERDFLATVKTQIAAVRSPGTKPSTF